MARGVNKVILIGNLGRDPELRYMPSGGAVVNVTLATSDSWKDKSSGESRERTEWHTVVFFNKLAEIVAKYPKKGSRIYVEGSLRTRKWQDKEGQDRYTTEVVATDMQMLDSRGGTSEDHASGSPHTGSSHPAASRQDSSASTMPTSAPAEDHFEDDDIPF